MGFVSTTKWISEGATLPATPDQSDSATRLTRTADRYQPADPAAPLTTTWVLGASVSISSDAITRSPFVSFKENAAAAWPEGSGASEALPFPFAWVMTEIFHAPSCTASRTSPP